MSSAIEKGKQKARDFLSKWENWQSWVKEKRQKKMKRGSPPCVVGFEKGKARGREKPEKPILGQGHEHRKVWEELGRCTKRDDRQRKKAGTLRRWSIGRGREGNKGVISIQIGGKRKL